MAAETSAGTVKQQIRTLREEKAGVEESGKREILRQKIRRLKRKTRKLSREARLAAAKAASVPTEGTTGSA